MPEIIKFFNPEDPYGFLSNFWRSEECLEDSDGNLWCYRTNEHFYQSMKAKNAIMSDWIKQAPSAFMAKRASRALKPDEIVDDWETKKVEVMLLGLRAKFGSRFNQDIKNQLLATGDAILVEDSPTDMFWGGSLPGSQNMLGRLLMQVREELRSKKEICDGECKGCNPKICPGGE
jgi:hypothetical protein